MADYKGNVESWAHAAVDVWERIYRVLMGLPHHRLAMISVSAGAIILSGPFWEPYLRAFAEQTLKLNVGPPTSPIWGAALVALGLGYHLSMTHLANVERAHSAQSNKQLEDRIRNHDAPIFDRFRAEAPEYAFKKALGDIADGHAYTSTQGSMIKSTYFFLDTTENKFNDTMVQDKASSLEKRLDELTDFMAQHFGVFGPLLPNGDLRLCLEPQWNMDRGGYPTREEALQYDALGRQLVKIVQATSAAYDDLLRAGHQRLL